MLFGSVEKFGIEVGSLSESLYSCEAWFCISGERINEGNKVALGTFVYSLDSFKEMHSRDQHPLFDASGMSDEEVFNVLDELGEGTKTFQGLRELDVWHYFKLYGIDDAVDGWQIFVYDVEGMKKILWQGMNPTKCPPSHLEQVRSATLPREEFLAILEEFSTYANGVWNARYG